MKKVKTYFLPKAVCSFLICGLGQVLNNQWGKAVIMWLLVFAICWFYGDPEDDDTIIPALTSIVWLWSIIDAYRPPVKIPEQASDDDIAASQF